MEIRTIAKLGFFGVVAYAIFHVKRVWRLESLFQGKKDYVFLRVGRELANITREEVHLLYYFYFSVVDEGIELEDENLKNQITAIQEKYNIFNALE